MALFGKPQQIQSSTQVVEMDEGLRSFMLKVYNYMASALILTGLVAYFASGSEAFVQAVTTTKANGMVGPSMLGWVVMLAPLAFVLFLGAGVQRFSQSTGQALFWAFSAVMGLSLYYIFQIYTGTSIVRVFFITAGTFGAMSLYGYTTQRDLTKLGSFLMMGLIGIILASLVNIFLASSALAFATSIIGVFIFIGLIAYDTQKLKSMYYSFAGMGDEGLGKAAIMGALSLYLDFINLFITLLRFFGERRS